MNIRSVQTLSLLPAGKLDPARLAPAAEKAIAELLIEGESANTRSSYRSAMRYWAGWFAFRYGQPIQLPVPVPVVMQFIVDHIERFTDDGLRHELPLNVDQALVDAGFKVALGAFKLSTLVHRTSVLSKAHQIKGLDNPCQDPSVKNLMAKTRRAYAKRGALPAGKPALTREPLEMLLATCDESLTGKRDRALLLMAWASGGRRRSEVVNADLKDLTREPGGSFVYHLGHSKTNQTGADRPGDWKPIAGPAADALRSWLEASGVKTGAIFRRIHNGTGVGKALSPSAVREIVKKRCALAGIEEKFAAHSLRSGFVTEAGRKGVALADVMALTGHTNVNTVMKYFRPQENALAVVGKLFDSLA